MLDFSTMNEPQRQAVTHGEGPLLLLAGPGSGKTFTITNRILHLLSQGVSPGEILVITFTKEAALSMQGRFQAMCGKQAYPVNFGTFHSVFYYILRESNSLVSTKVLTVSEKKNLMIPILNQYEESKDIREFLGEDALKILSAISFYKNTLQLTETVNKVPAPWQPHFGEIYKSYENAVGKLGQVDFDDMVYKCLKLLRENVAVRQYWQNRFRHILVDEFQDINPIQYETLKLLSPSPYNLFVVGDDDQAIYGFRGSQPDCLKKFLEDYNAGQLLLNLNYRSCPEIVEASLAVIGENKNRFEKKLKSAVSRDDMKREPAVVLTPFADNREQTQYLIGCLRQELSQNSDVTCAVLFRTNQMMQRFCAALGKAEIPYKMKEKSANMYDHFVSEDILGYLKSAGNMGSRESFLNIMNKPSRYLRRDMIVFEKGKLNRAKTIDNYRKSNLPEWEKVKISETLNIMEKQMSAIGKLPLTAAISYILKAVGYERYLAEKAGERTEKAEEWLEIAAWLKEDAAEYVGLEEWLTFQKEFAGKSEHQTNITRGKGRSGVMEQTVQQGAVELLTAHAAKGLEFDKVWIPDCNERVFPYGRMPDEKTVEEERRIFYVAMTRAKKCLELLYLTGTKERPRQPSAFLNPLYSPSTNSSNSQLSKYSSNASATFSYSSSSAIYSRTGSSLGSSGFSLYP